MSRRRKNWEDLGTKQKRRRLEELLASSEEGSESEEDNMNVSTSVPPSPPQFGPYDHIQDGQEVSHNEESIVEMTVDVECHPGGMGDESGVVMEDDSDPISEGGDESDEESSESYISESDVSDIENIENLFLNDCLTSSGDDVSDDDVQSEELREQKKFKKQLRNWKTVTGTAQTHFSWLLKIMRTNRHLSYLPSDCRTLMESLRKVEIVEMGSGSYYHFGLRAGIIKSLSSSNVNSDTPSFIDLIVNVDRVPLCKSSGKQFWPILVLIKGKKNPFAVGLFEDVKKPKSADDFLQYFIEDVLELEALPILWRGTEISIRNITLCCDAPAKSFLLCSKGHTGYYSCSKCITEGEYFKGHRAKRGHVVFPDLYAKLREDRDVRFGILDVGGDDDDDDDDDDEEERERIIATLAYRKKESPLTKLPNFNLVNSIVLDPMHLTDIGHMKRLLLEWTVDGKPGVKLSDADQKRLSDRIIACRNDVSDDFARKPRTTGLEELGRWKSTELRFFRMHLGPLVLKDILPDELYYHFLNFHVATRYLSMESFCQDEDYTIYCEQLIRNYINDAVAAYVFENFNQIIKNIVKKGNLHLQQAVKRLSESDLCKIPVPGETVSLMLLEDPHNDGPIPAGWDWKSHNSN